jgi:hypothetical protein
MKSIQGATMGICRYCGQKAGLFSDAHAACATSSVQKCDDIASVLASMISECKPRPNAPETFYQTIARAMAAGVKSQVDRIAHQIPADELRKALMRGWSAGAEELALKEPVSEGQFCVVCELYRAMGFSQQEVKRTDGYMAQYFSLLLWAVMVNGDPTPFASEHKHQFNLRSGEVPLSFFGSVAYSKEIVSSSYEGGYAGLSVPVGNGMYYHFGGFKSQRTDTSNLTAIDSGGMLLTTQSIYFGGEHTTFRLPYQHVVSFRPRPDGIGFFRDAGNSVAEVFTVFEAGPDGKPAKARPLYGWFLFNMARYLAHPETGTLCVTSLQDV